MEGLRAEANIFRHKLKINVESERLADRNRENKEKRKLLSAAIGYCLLYFVQMGAAESRACRVGVGNNDQNK